MSYSGGDRGYGRGRGGNFGRNQGFGGPKPVEVGKEYEVQVSEISRQGDGIARIQGFVIFVKGARVGEKTKIKILSVGPRFATAEKAGPSMAQQQPSQSSPTSEPAQVAPAVTEEEKPHVQDYKSDDEKPPAS
jgi:predicted RNA-binding protein with TRAM domain